MKTWKSLYPEIQADLKRKDFEQLEYRLHYLFREGIILGVPRKHVERFFDEQMRKLGIEFKPPARTRQKKKKAG